MAGRDDLSKEEMRERARRMQRHLRTRAEEQELKQQRKTRPARHHEREPADEDDDFQKIRRRERVLAPVQHRAVLPNSAATRATIVALFRGRARVLDPGGERSAVLAPDLAQAQQAAVAVGDEVVLHERGGAEPLVVMVLPRRTELSRPDPHLPGRRLVLAANVDLVVLVLGADRLRTGLIDRLQAALHGSLAALAVCVNKCDLPHDEAARERVLAPYRAAQMPIAVVSALRDIGLDALHALVRGHTVAFVGHSGAGKSTLLNRLDPDGARSTATVRARDGKGRHTTSASCMRVLADATRLIDTPGVRAFGLDEGDANVAAAFPEILALATGCRFRDCSHRHEPRCAVRTAVEQGELPAERLLAWLRLSGG